MFSGTSHAYQYLNVDQRMAAIGIHSLSKPRNTSREHRKKLEGMEVHSKRLKKRI